MATVILCITSAAVLRANGNRQAGSDPPGAALLALAQIGSARLASPKPTSIKTSKLRQRAAAIVVPAPSRAPAPLQ